MTCVAFVFARGGSKGVPKKNIRLLHGKPLIAYSIETARATPGIDRVIVSTDSEEIAEVARKFGAETPFLRPAHLAQDDSPEWLAWQHAVDFVEKNGGIDKFISLPATSPLRNVDDVKACLAALDDQTDIVVTVKNAGNNPYFNMLVRDEAGFSERVIRPEKPIVRRQDAPKVYDMTTVAYVTRPAFIKNHRNLFDGRVKSVVIPEERAVDIDNPLDFQFAEFLLREGNRA